MFRLRRYRFFIVFAFIAVGLVYHFKSISDHEGAGSTIDKLKNKIQDHDAVPTTSTLGPKEKNAATEGAEVADTGFPSKIKSGHHEGEDESSPPAPKVSKGASSKGKTDSAPITESTEGPNPKGHPKQDPMPLPTEDDATPVADGPAEPRIDPQGGGGRLEVIAATGKPKIHWTPLPEHFPIPSESIIPLPTGKAKSIPKIQHNFQSESSAEKKARQEKLDVIKEAFQYSWSGYKENAWLKDELSPVTGSYRNPFCGWAATLVDTLDTLWILGLEEEFKEAVDAVKEIDFTTSIRNDIPLFETVIRYLGGLIAAYDISGSVYKTLLDKAVELAEILIGAFDTPNRMPLTYYLWKPTFASQPHRAKTRVVLAEIGTLSLEFTRLAQITKEDKYYDAIARITNELEILQRNTLVPGLWPQGIDASGCKKPDRSTTSFQSSNDEQPLAISPAGEVHAATDGDSSDALQKRDVMTTTNADEKKETPPKQPDCEPQGLVSPPYSNVEYFGLGGEADSAYEYLPKEYMLLGGLEDKYRVMYELAADAVIERLLFRPMLPDESRHVLQAGLFRSNGKEDLNDGKRLWPEGTHLTCFVGGMFAVGSKIFNREKDLDRAKKLTDGCVWAYESTSTGIMPEGYLSIPCPDPKTCPWNETLWNNEIDPNWEAREENRLRQEQEKETRRKAKASSVGHSASSFAVASATAKDIQATPEATESGSKASTNTVVTPKTEGKNKETNQESEKKTGGSSETSKDNLKKRQLGEIDDSTPPKPGDDELEKAQDVSKTSTQTLQTGATTLALQSLETPTASSQLPETLDERELPTDSSNEEQEETEYTPPPIPTREEYIASRLESERLPKGMTKLNERKYILRPEAIESVFIMYRVTGEDYWREKGWKMFQAIHKYTNATYGASAISDVTSPEPRLLDEMESFWLAETLKYFYLLFSEPTAVSLDDYVLNTEAHPLKRPKP